MLCRARARGDDRGVDAMTMPKPKSTRRYAARAAPSRVQRINLVTPVDLLHRIDKWMKAQPGFPPSRSEAIRHMIEQFLDASCKDKKPKA